MLRIFNTIYNIFVLFSKFAILKGDPFPCAFIQAKTSVNDKTKNRDDSKSNNKGIYDRILLADSVL